MNQRKLPESPGPIPYAPTGAEVVVLLITCIWLSLAAGVLWLTAPAPKHERTMNHIHDQRCWVPDRDAPEERSIYICED